MSASVSLCIHANTLKICFYDGNRYYKAVTKYLVGKFSIPQWDKKKSKIKPSVPHSAENNEILFNLLSKYNNVIAVNKNITAKELSCFFDKKMSRPPVSIDELIQRDVEMESKKTGSNYKNYEQLRRYLLRFCPNLKDTGISQINESFCAGFRDWPVNSPSINYEKTTKCFIALLNRISNDRTVSWHIENINGYNFKKNAPLCNKVDELPTILNENEIQSFYSFDPTASRGKRTAKNVELYHDYCIFMLETLMRPVDVLLLKTDNIKACRIGCNKPFVQYIPKKMENRICSHKTVMLPLSSTALELIEKYKNQAPDGYIFPFADDRQILKHKNGMERFTKRINKQINTWLKTVDKALNFGKGEDISLYMFRHTSISVALNVRKLPASTVAKLAGTSIAMIEKHYNNHTVVNIPLGILEAFGEKITHRKAI